VGRQDCNGGRQQPASGDQSRKVATINWWWQKKQTAIGHDSANVTDTTAANWKICKSQKLTGGSKRKFSPLVASLLP